MIEISKKDLYKKYGIVLEKGLYSIENVNNVYTINSVQDDTSGCLLVGTSVQGDKLLNSKLALKKLLEILKKALSDKEQISIKVRSSKKETTNPVQPVETKVEEVKKVIPTTPVKPEVVVSEKVQTQNKQPLIKTIIQWILKLISKN